MKAIAKLLFLSVLATSFFGCTNHETVILPRKTIYVRSSTPAYRAPSVTTTIPNTPMQLRDSGAAPSFEAAR